MCVCQGYWYGLELMVLIVTLAGDGCMYAW